MRCCIVHNGIQVLCELKIRLEVMCWLRILLIGEIMGVKCGIISIYRTRVCRSSCDVPPLSGLLYS